MQVVEPATKIATEIIALDLNAQKNDSEAKFPTEAISALGEAAYIGIDRLFREAQAGQVMAPTVDVTLDLIAKTLRGLPLF